MTNILSEPFAVLQERARAAAQRRGQILRIAELVQEIDKLSEEMGVPAFRDCVRQHGYDIDADLGMLLRRGVDRFN